MRRDCCRSGVERDTGCNRWRLWGSDAIVEGMDKQTMLRYWQIMGICQLDEDHMTLQTMDQTPEVAWLCEVAEEAKAAHDDWLTEHYPERITATHETPLA